jgi:hypothetical protein
MAASRWRPPFGEQVVDSDGHRLGRVVAIIHHATGVDVIVEKGRWFRRRNVRIPAEHLTRGSGQTLVYGTAPVAAWRAEGARQDAAATPRAQHGG